MARSKGGKGGAGGAAAAVKAPRAETKKHVKMVLPKITKDSPLRAMAAAAAEATQGKFEVFPMVATFLNKRNKEMRRGGSAPGEYERGCSLSTAQAQLKKKVTLACVVELAVQSGRHESSYAGMGPNGGEPSAHSMALVKHEGVLYVFDPQHRAETPRKNTVSPGGLRPLLGKFGQVRYLSGGLPAKDEKCRAGVLAFIARLAADLGAELGKFELMRK
jgi:hypothetical protein